MANTEEEEDEEQADRPLNGRFMQDVKGFGTAKVKVLANNGEYVVCVRAQVPVSVHV